MADEKTPISERSSAHSRNLDGVKDGAGVLRVMAACDRELYANHWGGYPGLANAAVMLTVAELADVAAECIRVNDQRPPSTTDNNHKDDDEEEEEEEEEENGRPSSSSKKRARRRLDGGGGKAAVFITGAGTSGRLAFLAAYTANATLRARGKTPCFHHIIAGGTPALFQCVESAEDDAAAAAADFDAALAAAGGDDITDALIVGVSCGLSATYVSTQLARAMDDPKGRFNVACLGFNPKKFAKAGAAPAPATTTTTTTTSGGGGGGGCGGGTADGGGGDDGGGDGGGADTTTRATAATTVSAAGASFRDVLWRMEEDEGGILCAAPRALGLRLRRRLAITPVVGPEAVTGSSRLKGGTATKLVLDAAFTAATVLAEAWAVSLIHRSPPHTGSAAFELVCFPKPLTGVSIHTTITRLNSSVSSSTSNKKHVFPSVKP